ncbi:MAG: hypothetical protein K6G61_06590 [Solobacterium sp.]|nr:hypothetical protein [Solobacterium sp.]
MLKIIKKLDKDRVIIAVDGRCASGKSTFAAELAEELDANLFHMDDFFLQPHQRTKERYSTPGENADHERFLQEVLLPLEKGVPFRYAPFDCRKMCISEEMYEVFPKKYNVIEGSYSFHKDLSDHYDLKIFLTADMDVRLARIRRRNPDKVNDFVEKWIPLEELYFSSLNVMEKADLILDTSREMWNTME